ncbi:MAG: hypothetical protein JXQ73_06935 [Phycisphaerae bacterium]|nr:hypothetical protein [Phycisphaerae bacterium]
MPDESVTSELKPSWRRHSLAALGLLIVLAAAHGASLWDGLFFDDYWHRVTLREYGWGFHDLIESATFDVPGRLTHLWWQTQPLQWRYTRAVAMFFMKLELVISGGSPVGVHACSLVWHLLTALLVYRLAVWAGLAWRWALLAGVAYVINPHSVFAISWIAARNAQVSALFFVAAVLMYALASIPDRTAPSPLRPGRLLLCVILWVLALFSRESAVIFPIVVLVLDASVGGRRHLLRRLPVHAVFGLIAAAYLYYRLFVFPEVEAPSIYFTTPSGASYLSWAASKLLQMLFATAFYTPMFLGMATYTGLSGGHLLVYLVMATMVGLLGVWYVLASRGRRDRWVWPVWLVAAYLPVIPVFITPHFSLLPFAAWAVMIPIGLSRLPRFWRPVVTAIVIAATLWSVAVYRVLWRGIVRSEQLIYADILATNTPPPEGSKLFFINLPIAGIYAPVALRELWGIEDLDGYVLTFAPHPLMMTERSSVKRVGDRELVVTTLAPGYFSGVGGRMLLDGTRPGEPLMPGAVVRGELFDTTVLDADERGARSLKFTFHESLDSDRFLIFVSTPDRPAYRVCFSRPGCALAEETYHWQRACADMLVARERFFIIDRLARRLVHSDLFLTAKHDR